MAEAAEAADAAPNLLANFSSRLIFCSIVVRNFVSCWWTEEVGGRGTGEAVKCAFNVLRSGRGRGIEVGEGYVCGNQRRDLSVRNKER